MELGKWRFRVCGLVAGLSAKVLERVAGLPLDPPAAAGGDATRAEHEDPVAEARAEDAKGARSLSAGRGRRWRR
eukprot:11485753-Alexandrium_andersonii.AAC.1